MGTGDGHLPSGRGGVGEAGGGIGVGEGRHRGGRGRSSAGRTRLVASGWPPRSSPGTRRSAWGGAGRDGAGRAAVQNFGSTTAPKMKPPGLRFFGGEGLLFIGT